MDTRTLNNNLAQRLGIDSKTASAYTAQLVELLSQHLSELDSVAIPGFGNFESVKEDEHIEKDSSTGRTMLVPPSIKVNFKPAARLRKSTQA